ncbi:hypothetical protein PM082_018222 [Marasmius tenuissimus]|nr:hypothetical protein PM082_018222 [Marasmius tenuissimus]
MLEIALQIVVFGLTFLKTYNLKGAWLSSRTLSWVLNRDALLVFVAITGILASVAGASYRPGAAKVFTFPLLVAATSVASCRAIMDLQTLTEQPEPHTSEDFVLSTVGSVWDARTLISGKLESESQARRDAVYAS